MECYETIMKMNLIYVYIAREDVHDVATMKKKKLSESFV